MRDFLYRDRTKLSVYALAMFGLALEKQHEADKLAMIMQNISQYVVEDNENQTAYLNLPARHLVVLVRQRIRSQRLLPEAARRRRTRKTRVAPRLVKYLVNNRKHATYWNSTRDTALVHRSLRRLHQSQRRRQARPDRRSLGRRPEAQRSRRSTPTTSSPSTTSSSSTATPSTAGQHTIELRKTGTGPLYYNGYLTNFTLEDDIRHAGLELKVDRQYYKLTPADKTIEVAGGRGQVVDQKVEKYDRTEIPNLGERQKRRPHRDRTRHRIAKTITSTSSSKT